MKKGLYTVILIKLLGISKKNIRSKRLLIHDSSNRDEVLEKHT